MYYIVYKIINKVNSKFYIGRHQTKNFNDGYMGSGKLIRRAIAKHGIENFIKEILYFYETKEEMFSKEIELINHNDAMSYNLVPGGKGGYSMLGKHHSTETKEKLRFIFKDVPFSEERKQKLRVPKPNLKGRIRSEAHCQSLRKPKSNTEKMGRYKRSEFHKQEISKRRTGKSWGKHTQETKQIMQIAHIGKIVSKKTRNKQRQIALNRPEEHNKKISIAIKNKPKLQCQYCHIIINEGNFYRWHGEKCKQKKS